MEKIKNFLLKNNSAKQTLTKNTIWLFTSDIISKILRMCLVVYAARNLGASGWGIFSYATSIGVIIMTFSDIGISGIITREAIQKKENYKNFITTALLIKSSLLIISILLILALGPIISSIPETKGIFAFIATISLFDSLRELCFSINNSLEKMERETFTRAVMNTVTLIAGIILLKINLDPKSMALAYALGSFVGFLIIAIIIRKDFKNLLNKIDISMIKPVLNVAWPFAIITLSVILLANIDTFMLGIWKDAKEIGLYSSTQRLYAFLAIIPSTISVAIFPAMSKFSNTDKNKFRILLEKSISIMLFACAPIALGGTILSKEIIILVFGNNYIEAVSIMKIMMAMTFFSFPLVLFSNSILAYNQQKNISFGYIIGIIFNVLLNIILIPKFGALGATITTLFSTIIITVFIVQKLKRINDFKIFPSIKKVVIPLLVLVVMLITFKNLNINLILVIILSSFAYLITLFLTKEPLIQEIKEIFSKNK